MDCPPKKNGFCREVAVAERWPLVEVRLFLIKKKIGWIFINAR